MDLGAWLPSRNCHICWRHTKVTSSNASPRVVERCNTYILQEGIPVYHWELVCGLCIELNQQTQTLNRWNETCSPCPSTTNLSTVVKSDPAHKDSSIKNHFSGWHSISKIWICPFPFEKTPLRIPSHGGCLPALVQCVLVTSPSKPFKHRSPAKPIPPHSGGAPYERCTNPHFVFPNCYMRVCLVYWYHCWH